MILLIIIRMRAVGGSTELTLSATVMARLRRAISNHGFQSGSSELWRNKGAGICETNSRMR
jgi:hypothetical protein